MEEKKENEHANIASDNAARGGASGGGYWGGSILRKKERPQKLYRIGDLIEYSELSRQTIHNYTLMGLIPENKWTKGGHRLYDESVFERLDVIRQMRERNNTLHKIRDFFVSKEQNIKPGQG